GWLSESCIGLSNPDGGLTDAPIWSANANRRPTNSNIRLADSGIRLADACFRSSMFWSNMRPHMTMVKSIKCGRADKTPAISWNINVGIVHVGRLRLVRDDGLLRFGFGRVVVSGAAVWHPLSVLVGFPLVVVPKNARLKNWRVTTCFSATRRQRKT